MASNIIIEFFVPLIVSFLYLFYYIKYHRINEPKFHKYRKLMLMFDLRIDSWIKTILIPVIASIFTINIISLYYNQTPIGREGSLLYNTITAGFLSPIFEEVLMRGIMLGGVILFIRIFIIKNIDDNGIVIPIAVLLLSSLLFILPHENITYFQVYMRFFGGILYGVLYLINKYNLLPSIIARMTWNLYLTF